MISIAKQSAEVPDTGPQIMKRGVLGQVSPDQRAELVTWLAAIAAEGQICEQNALSFSRRGHPCSARKRNQFETAKQA